jgi:hypothetical protein
MVLVAQFASVSSKPDKDTLIFRGRGQIADPIWQRALDRFAPWQ